MDNKQGTRKRPVEAFGKALRAAWVADLESEPAPAMPVLEAAQARVRVGGVA